jgi:hypothetical protein
MVGGGDEIEPPPAFSGLAVGAAPVAKWAPGILWSSLFMGNSLLFLKDLIYRRASLPPS